MPDIVNPQITDAVTQANVHVLGDAPAVAASTLYQSVAQSAGMAAQNAVSAQQQLNVIHQATTAQGVALILGTSTAAAKSEVKP